jgi:hypothetical protein
MIKQLQSLFLDIIQDQDIHSRLRRLKAFARLIVHIAPDDINIILTKEFIANNKDTFKRVIHNAIECGNISFLSELNPFIELLSGQVEKFNNIRNLHILRGTIINLLLNRQTENVDEHRVNDSIELAIPVLRKFLKDSDLRSIFVDPDNTQIKQGVIETYGYVNSDSPELSTQYGDGYQGVTNIISTAIMFGEDRICDALLKAGIMNKTNNTVNRVFTVIHNKKYYGCGESYLTPKYQ